MQPRHIGEDGAWCLCHGVPPASCEGQGSLLGTPLAGLWWLWAAVSAGVSNSSTESSRQHVLWHTPIGRPAAADGGDPWRKGWRARSDRHSMLVLEPSPCALRHAQGG